MATRVKRIAVTLALLASTAALPGCMFAVGSRFGNEQQAQMDALERRISTAEERLGISSHEPLSAAGPQLQD